MNLDPAAFSIPAPRVCIGPGERAVVFEALYWGMPERRGDQAYDPLQCMWGSASSGELAIDTEKFGFSLEQLDETRRVLTDMVEDPLFTIAATRECAEALRVVDFARDLLIDAHIDDGS